MSGVGKGATSLSMCAAIVDALSTRFRNHDIVPGLNQLAYSDERESA
jgi:hypothetical protein